MNFVCSVRAFVALRCFQIHIVDEGFKVCVQRRLSVAAFNNLAVAYEHEGEFDKARKAYERALELEPENQMIRQNYELFKEINDRTSRRGSR